MVRIENPDLGVPTPRPPVEERGAAPQTPLHKVRSVSSLARFALASHYGSICGQAGRASLLLSETLRYETLRERISSALWVDLWVGFIDIYVGNYWRFASRISLCSREMTIEHRKVLSNPSL
jgi:hypothetical protein